MHKTTVAGLHTGRFTNGSYTYEIAYTPSDIVLRCLDSGESLSWEPTGENVHLVNEAREELELGYNSEKE